MKPIKIKKLMEDLREDSRVFGDPWSVYVGASLMCYKLAEQGIITNGQARAVDYAIRVRIRELPKKEIEISPEVKEIINQLVKELVEKYATEVSDKEESALPTKEAALIK